MFLGISNGWVYDMKRWDDDTLKAKKIRKDKLNVGWTFGQGSTLTGVAGEAKVVWVVGSGHRQTLRASVRDADETIITSDQIVGIGAKGGGQGESQPNPHYGFALGARLGNLVL